MIYGAMFDEVDEGTAMYKCVADKKDLPTQAQDRLVYFNIEGENVPSDRYLWLAGQGGRMLHRKLTLTSVMPTQPAL